MSAIGWAIGIIVVIVIAVVVIGAITKAYNAADEKYEVGTRGCLLVIGIPVAIIGIAIIAWGASVGGFGGGILVIIGLVATVFGGALGFMAFDSTESFKDHELS